MMEFYRRWLNQIRLNYVAPLDRQRALGLMWAILSLTIVWFFAFMIFIGPSIFTGQNLPERATPILLVIPIIFYAVHYFTQRGNLSVAIYLFVGLLLVSTYAPLLYTRNQATIILLTIPLVAAGFLLSRREMVVYVILFNLVGLVVAYNISQTIDPLTLLTSEVAGALLLVGLTSTISLIFVWVFNSGTETYMRTSVITLRRYEQMADVNQTLGKARDDNAVLLVVAELLIDRLLYIHAQVHLFDSENQLHTYVRTGMGTRHTVNPTELHRVEGSALKMALETQNMIMVTLQDSSQSRLHLLPSANSGVIIPLLQGSRVIGFLDVQSNRQMEQFGMGDLILLKLVASELTSHLARVRELNTLRRVLDERDTAQARMERQMARLRQQAEQSAGSDWRQFIEGRGVEGFGFDLLRHDQLLLTPARDLPAELQPALASGEMIIQQTEDEQVVMVPILFRQEVLGAMRFTIPKDRVISDRQRDLAYTVAQRLALALENARLVEQSRTQAERERTASEFSQLLLGQQDIDLLLQVAAENFKEALGAVYTQVYLEPEARPLVAEEAAE